MKAMGTGDILDAEVRAPIALFGLNIPSKVTTIDFHIRQNQESKGFQDINVEDLVLTMNFKMTLLQEIYMVGPNPKHKKGHPFETLKKSLQSPPQVFLKSTFSKQEVEHYSKS